MYKSPPAVLSKDFNAINSEPLNLDAAWNIGNTVTRGNLAGGNGVTPRVSV